ncbi:MAG: ribonuclease P protein component [Proteobacteria bacterium]|nr:ribonuclease P protein component [Pseudomonadota bacterium]MCH8976217.1 ribonuclease P protein component [Pseudomonadota bacterium]
MSTKTGKFVKSNRIVKPEDYRQVFKSSCRSVDDTFLVIAKKNDLKRARLGLAISRKNINKAVSRNNIKRAIRESFRYHKNILKGIDVVVVVHRKQTTINIKIINESLGVHWKNISQCKNF